MNTPVPDGSYLVYSLGVEKNLFEGDFSIMEIKENNKKLVIQSRTGEINLTRSESGTSWTGGGYTIEARQGLIRSNPMMIGKLSFESEGISPFAAIRLQADLSPILMDGKPTDYDIFFQDDTDGTLNVQKSGDGLRFGVSPHGGPTVYAVAPGGQSPGRFNADKESSDGHDLYGFVLPHRIWEDDDDYRVLVGYARKPSQFPLPDDIDPYVAVSARPGKPPYGEG